jgi:hypothetical protein
MHLAGDATRHCERSEAIQCGLGGDLDEQVRPAPQAEAMSGGHGDLLIFVASLLAMTDQ